MERQIAELSSREGSTIATVGESNQSVKDVLLAKDQTGSLVIEFRHKLAQVIEAHEKEVVTTFGTWKERYRRQ